MSELTKCPDDTDGDGNCGKLLCPYCGVHPQAKEVKGHIDPEYTPPKLAPGEMLEARFKAIELAIGLQSQYVEYLRGFIENVITPLLPKPIAPHDMEVWTAIQMAQGDQEKLNASMQAIRERREKDKPTVPRIELLQ